MKTKNILFALTAICFSILFYKQGVGLNYLIFGIIVSLLSFFAIAKKQISAIYLTGLFGLISASFFAMYYGNSLAIAMSILSLTIIFTAQRWQKTSIITAMLYGTISVLGSAFSLIKDCTAVNNVKKRLHSSQTKKFSKWIPLAITIGVLFLFMGLYRSINPVFDQVVISISENIGWGWFFFTIFGAIVLYPFFHTPRIIKQFIRKEYKLKHTISETDSENSFLTFPININSEKYSAILIFSLLNALILFLNSTDTYFLFFEKTLPYDLTYSDYVHQGVGAVIFSIILAISLILFYFRSSLNFDKESKNIKILSYIWLIQNVLLVVLTLFKNHMYIDVYSLTYKRIGVYFYLFFVASGLLFTMLKLYKQHTVWLLIKNNAIVIYSTLIIACFFNWNSIVTNYNLAQQKETDHAYLLSLGYENYPTLWKQDVFKYVHKTDIAIKVKGTVHTYSLPAQVSYFLKNYKNNNWQSYCNAKQKTYDYFMQLAVDGKLPLSNTNEIEQNNIN